MQKKSAMDRAPAGEMRHVAYGPYESLAAGVYRAEFELAGIDVDIEPVTILAKLDVSCDCGAVVIAERSVSAHELGSAAKTFSILFELQNIHDDLEYRILTTGEGEFQFAVPRVVRVSGVLDLPPKDELATMDPAAVGEDTRRILRRLEPRTLCDVGFVRVGNPGDGGYVCIDDWDGIDTAFSFGINDDISWDSDIADRGLRIYQFDHTVTDPAPEDDRMIFEPKMIAAEGGPGKQDLASLIRLHDKGHARPNIILKTDIEGGEWWMLNATSDAELGRIAWLTGEFHYFQGLAEPRYRARLDRALERLARTFALVHVHSNVWGGYSSLGNVIFPNVIEATFVNKAFYSTDEGREVFPTALDRTCDHRVPDFFLGAFRF